MRHSYDSVESNMIYGIDKKRSDDEARIRNEKINAETEKIAHEYMAQNPPRLEMKDFLGHPGYDDAETLRNINKTALDEKWLEKKDKFTLAGKMMESVFSDFGETWFYEGVKFVFVTKYDDINSGGDVVMEIKRNDGSVTRILIDLTTAENPANTDEKFYPAKNDFGLKSLGNVEYFSSKLEDYTGELKNIPRVVAGVSESTLKDFCQNIAKNGKESQRYSPIQLMILDEMIKQLIYFHAEAEKTKSGSRAENTLREASDAIQEILTKKASLRTYDYKQKASKDRVYQRLTF